MIKIGNTLVGKFNNPAISCLDTNLAGHFEAACKILEANREYHNSPVRTLAFTKPELLLRNSTTTALFTPQIEPIKRLPMRDFGKY